MTQKQMVKKLTNQKTLFQWPKLLKLLESTLSHCVAWLMKKRLNAIKLFPDKENLIDSIWRKCVILFLLIKKSTNLQLKTSYMLESLHESKWTIFLDNLNILRINEQNTLHIYLLRMWLLESISIEKDYRPYWTNAYKELSAKLSSPIEIDSVDLDSTSLNLLLKNKEEKLQSLMTNKIKVVNKNSPKTCYQLYTSSAVDKWEKEVTDAKIQKTLKVKLQLNHRQKIIFNDWIDTYRYVYNKTIKAINNGHKPNFINLRDLLVTENTKKGSNEYKSFDVLKAQLAEDKKNINKEITEIKKLLKINNNDKILNNKLLLIQQKLKDKIDEIELTNQKRRDIVKNIKSDKNPNVNEWETNTPKSVRECAVKEAIAAFTSALAQKKLGIIKHFSLGYRKKTKVKKCITVPPCLIGFNKIEKTDKIDYTTIKIAPDFFNEDQLLKININTAKRIDKKYTNLTIEQESKITKYKNDYYIHILVNIQPKNKEKLITYCGIDPGIRTFLTVFNNEHVIEYKHNNVLLDKLNKQIDTIKSQKYKKRIRKKAFNKREIRKTNVINEFHWLSINKLLAENDVIFYGDIKSHDIVKHKKNKHLNRVVNDLKLYTFKQRLLYKAEVINKLVFTVNEAYTTKTCSFCGTLNNPGNSAKYTCLECKKTVGRDVNAAKNILMKGIITNLY